MDYMDSILKFWEKIRSGNQTLLKFKKKDGTERIMRCTLNFDKIPKEKQPKNINVPQIIKLVKKNNLLRVYDLDKNDWRSVPFDRVEWLQGDDNKRFYLKR